MRRMRHRSTLSRSACVALLILSTAGCGDTEATMKELVRFALREGQRRDDARSVREDLVIEASFHGDLDVVRRLLDADPKGARGHLRSRDPVGMTALHRAVWGGHPEIVKLLLERGAEVEARDGAGQTPLSLAARWGRADIMDLLLKRGADPSARDDMGRTLLHYAAQYGHLEVMRVLLDRGFDPDVSCKTGTPLHSAAQSRQLEAARYLLDRGGHADRRGYLDWLPLHVACAWSPGYPEELRLALVTLLIDRGGGVSARANGGTTPLVLAAIGRDSALTILLLARGARPEPATPGNASALRSALDAGSPAVARLLLEHGADANERYSPPGRARLLHRVGDPKDIDMARVLLEFGADANAVDDQGGTPLHVAAREGNAELIRLLAERRAVVDARDKSNWTPLHFASSQKKVEATRALLRAGADRYARTKGGETPHKLAWGAGAESVRALLGPPDPSPKGPFGF